MKNKKAISLIVLVIIIIVMIILASAIILSLNNNRIIDRAKEAVRTTDEAEVKQIAQLVWAEAYMNKLRGSTLATEVKERLKEKGITEEDWNIQVTDTGVVIAPKEQPESGIFSFSIDGITYQAENGMTWQQWIESDYNTVEAIASNMDVVQIGDKFVTYSDGLSNPHYRDKIVVNSSYILSSSIVGIA